MPRPPKLARFIPARAGNTTAGHRRCSPRPVHPRASGEHIAGADPIRQYAGSSPRERGTHVHLITQRPKLRFIPARAGNTSPPSPPTWPRAVHPRASGEHIRFRDVSPGPNGSSPRERGTPARADTREHHHRFIPARAGNTWAVRLQPPVMCGSSPRERGTQNCNLGYRDRPRFIPARAGNTMRHQIRHPRPAVHPRASGEH